MITANYTGPLDIYNVGRVSTRHLRLMLQGRPFRALDDEHMESRLLSDDGRRLVRDELSRRGVTT